MTSSRKATKTTKKTRNHPILKNLPSHQGQVANDSLPEHSDMYIDVSGYESFLENARRNTKIKKNIRQIAARTRRGTMKIETFLFGSFIGYINLAMGLDILMSYSPSIGVHGSAFAVPRWTGWPIMFFGELVLACIACGFFKKNCKKKQQSAARRTPIADSPHEVNAKISGWETCCALGIGLTLIFKGFLFALADYSERGLGPQPFPAPQSIGWPTALLGIVFFVGGLYFYIRDNNEHSTE